MGCVRVAQNRIVYFFTSRYVITFCLAELVSKPKLKLQCLESKMLFFSVQFWGSFKHTGILVMCRAAKTALGCVLIPDKLRHRVMNHWVNMGFPCWGVTQLERQETILNGSSLGWFTNHQLSFFSHCIITSICSLHQLSLNENSTIQA